MTLAGGNYELRIPEQVAEDIRVEYNMEDNTITLTAEETSLDELNIEKLNSSDLILSWISDEAEFESDTTDETFSAQVTIEAFFKKE